MFELRAILLKNPFLSVCGASDVPPLITFDLQTRRVGTRSALLIS